MINTFYGQDTLDTSKALLAALVVGMAFGFALERAGFGSSRRLTGIFYFRDMAVLKVMFTAVVVGMIGLWYFVGLGWIAPDHVYFMPSIYGAQIVGGLIFGVGFVMGGWCPGTAAVGAVSGKVDALVFLGGAVIGSVAFNELYGVVAPLASWGGAGVRHAWESLGVSRPAFAIAFAAAAVGCFWGGEYIEKKMAGTGPYWGTPFLKAFSVAILVFAAGLGILSGSPATAAAPTSADQSVAAAAPDLLAVVESGADHIEPEELADRLVGGDQSLVLVDIRTPPEFAAFHIRGAVNVAMSYLPDYLAPHRDGGSIVLYSNGMTHPAQARDALARSGFTNAYLLTDGLEGFMERCLMPVSLRAGPVAAAQAARINAWRRFFLAAAQAGVAAPAASRPAASTAPAISLPGLIETSWLADNLGRSDVRVIDVRPQPSYNTSHIPGAVCLSPESFRGVVKGISSMLLPAKMLAAHMSLMGIRPDDTIVLIAPDKMQDATLIAIGLERLGHRKYGILAGGFEKWARQKRPVTTELPSIAESDYPVDPKADRFTVEASQVLEHVKTRRAVILDVRPADYFSGKKSDEARAGHIPGAVNRPFSADFTVVEGAAVFKPIDELAKAYAALIPSKDGTVVIHCRTGHQASQAYFVVKHLLGYTDVYWYDAGWTEWAARPELPLDRP